MKPFACALLLAGTVSAAALEADVKFFVSPNGSDQNSGSAAQPFRTLHRAAEAAAGLSGRRTVEVAPGVYYLGKTLKLGMEHSGIRFVSTTEGGAVLSGGVRLENLKFTPFRDGILTADAGKGREIDQLFLDGRRQAMARYPNRVEGRNVFDTWQLEHGANTSDSATDPLNPERTSRWKHPETGYLHAMHGALWGDMHWRITGRNPDGTLRLEGGWQNNRPSPMHKRYRMVENIFEELDAPGEWFYDRDSGKLYVYPEPGVDPNRAAVETVSLRRLVDFDGARQTVFDGFTFRHAARTFMENKEPLLRSDWTLCREAAVLFRNSEDCALLNCEFSLLGGNAVLVSNFNRRIAIRGGLFREIGANAVVFAGNPAMVRSPLFRYEAPFSYEKLDRAPGPLGDDYPADCVVEDCLLTRTGRDEKQTAPIQISMSRNITVRACTIHDVPRAGINISEGTWGGHLVEWCDVFNTVLETGDHGSFNSWGRDRFWTPSLAGINREHERDPALPFADAVAANVLRHNRWSCDHGWGIDLDDGSSNYEITGNLILKGGLKLREGYRRIVRNNLIVNDSLHAHCWLRDSGDVFAGNLVMGAYRPALMDRAWGLLVDYNIFASSEADRDRFRARGCDAHSTVLDAKFRNPAAGDYTVENLPAGSPFVNFPMNRFGVRSPKLRKLAKQPQFPLPAAFSGTLVPAAAPEEQEWRGTKVREITEQEFSAFGVPRGTRGVEVRQGAGPLLAGDLITAVDGRPVAVPGDLPAAETARQAELVRNQKRITVKLRQ